MSSSSGPDPVPVHTPTSPELAELAERMARVETALQDGHRRAAHRETQIDRLHEENQQLRVGVHRQLLEPVVSDLIRLYDGLRREGSRLACDQATAGAGSLLDSFADDVELALDRCGVEVVTALAGETFRAGQHAAVGVEHCATPELDNTVAVAVGAGLRDRESGRMRRLPKARFFRFTASVEAPDPDGEKELSSSADGRLDL